MTVPNQNIIIIHRQMPQKNFLQIKNENWQNMLLQTKDPYAFSLYIYLAANANNFKLELSPQAIQNAIGMPRSTFYKKLQLLKNNGYIIEKQGNVLEFFEVPQKQNSAKSGLSCEQQNLSEEQQNPQQRQGSLPPKQNIPRPNREIDNIDNNRYYTDKVIDTNNSNETKPFSF